MGPFCFTAPLPPPMPPMLTERYYAVDADGAKWTLKATSLPEAQAEIAETYFLRRIATHISRVTEETLPND